METQATSHTRYDVLKGPDGLARAQTVWRTLERDTKAPYFQSYACARAWYETLGHRVDADPRLVVLQDEGRPVGLFPACIVRTRGIRVLTWMGTPHVTDSGDVLFDSARTRATADEFVRRSLRLLKSEDRGSPFLFANVKDTAVARPALAAALRSYKHGVVLYVPTEGDSVGYLASLASRQRNTIKRRIKKLERDGDCRFDVLSPRDEAAGTVLRHLFELKIRQREEAGLRIDLVDEDFLAFCLKQTEYGIEGHLATLEFDGQTIAGWFNVQHNDRLYGVFTAYDPGYRPYSPGTVLTWFVIEDCFKRGLVAYDMGYSGDAYKYEWNPVEVTLSTFVDRGPVGSLLCLAARARNRYLQLGDPYEAVRQLGKGSLDERR
jgi:CelD/BcsL family acetyltransferase involved in cellulose biosynthesis